MDSEPAVRNQPPPELVLKVLNPVFRRLLTSPLAGRMPPVMAVLQFTGRRTGRPFSVPVGVHEVADGSVVFTEAPWRHNFAGGRELVLRRGRDVRRGRGTLVQDPDTVAHALAQAMQRAGARNLAMQVTPGRTVTHDDLVQLGRNLVRVDP